MPRYGHYIRSVVGILGGLFMPITTLILAFAAIFLDDWIAGDADDPGAWGEAHGLIIAAISAYALRRVLQDGSAFWLLFLAAALLWEYMW
ncbi:hypothetical protein QBC46DRAFT_346020 [Diplogelasinospora grovesii]|uniref:Uncharacterized protein n=1 Tax=Diplogelasinospora grovesii TaxID=303347 RepID=A0AAN6MZI4_9PEZI|nr:hypothetical protein QBC46DRAFT_346020 [Diplogelasinospora grovesii]